MNGDQNFYGQNFPPEPQQTPEPQPPQSPQSPQPQQPSQFQQPQQPQQQFQSQQQPQPQQFSQTQQSFQPQQPPQSPYQQPYQPSQFPQGDFQQTPQSQYYSPTSSGRRNTPLIIAGAIFLLLILIGGIFLFTRGKKEKIYDMGEEISVKGRTVKVISAEKDWKSSLDIDKPEKGKKFVVIKVKIKNNTRGTIKYSETNDFDIEDANGKITDYPSIGGYGLSRISEGSLRPGAEVTGDVVFEVDEDALDKVYLIYYPDFNFTKKVKNKQPYIKIRLQEEKE